MSAIFRDRRLPHEASVTNRMKMTTKEFLADLATHGIELWVDGERLRYRAPSGTMTRDRLTELEQRKAELLSQLRDSRSRSDTAAPSSLPVDDAHRNDPFPITDLQQAYWIGRSTTQGGGDVAAYSYVELDFEELDIDRLDQVWQRLIGHHEMLRMVVEPDGRGRILPDVPRFQTAVEDLRGWPAARVSEKLDSIRDQMSHQVLPANRWPLFDIRASLIDGGRVRLHIGIDLLIADAASILLLIRESVALYQNPKGSLSPLNVSFRDYALAEQAARDSADWQTSLSYWRERFETFPPAPGLPLAKSPLAIRHPRFVRRSTRLVPGVWQKLKARAAAHDLTPSMLLCTAYAEVLARWSRNKHLLLNLTLFNRLPLHPQIDAVVGDFTSGLLLSVDATGGESFVQRACELQEQLWSSIEHARVSSVQVLRELARSRGRSGEPMAPVVFTSLLQHGETAHEAEILAGLDRLVFGISQTPQVWLDHQVFELGGCLIFNWDAVEELFPAGLLDDLFDSYCRLLHRLATEDAVWTQTDCLPLPEHQRRQQADVNETGAARSEECLHTLFAAQLRQRPDQIALVSQGCRMSYRELGARAARIGQWLLAQGCRPGQLVAVVMEKGWEQVAATLGVLAAGAAYVPLDPSLPAERFESLLIEAAVDQALTQSRFDLSLAWPEGVRRYCPDLDTPEGESFPDVALQNPHDLAYVIYTSGSTGRPKGVMIEHRAAVNTILDINRRFAIGPSDRVLALSSLSFDLSVYDIFGVLAAGGTIVMPDPDANRDAAHWARLMEREGVTLWNSVPSLMEMLVSDCAGRGMQLAASLRLVLLSGDWIPLGLPDQIRALRPESRIISLGGATEAAIWSILYPIEEVDPTWPSIPYGQPMTNQRFYVLDERMAPCPTWTSGNLYIAGDGLARGYWADAEKTSARFPHHPQTGERLYRTGDLGRYLPDGTIEFMGREDFQVKIQGHRIELGEIEAALEQHPFVRQSVVTAVGEQKEKRRLVAYVVPAAREEDSDGNTVDADAQLEESVREAGRREAARLPPNMSEFSAAMALLEQVSLAAVCRTLLQLGCFSQPGEQRTVADLIAIPGVQPRYRNLLDHWLDMLAEAGLLQRQADRVFVSSRPLPSNDVNEGFARIRAMNVLEETLLDYLQSCCDNHRGLFCGEVDALELLFPRGSHHIAESLYQRTPFALYLHTICGALIEAIVQRRANRTLRILEVGAGIGGTTAYLLPMLPEEGCSYTFTDVSPFFTSQARTKFIRYPFMEYALLDLNENPFKQGFSSQSFDVIVAANVLHGLRDLPQSLKYLRSLLTQDGHLLIVEGTWNLRALMISVRFIEGLNTAAERADGKAEVLLSSRRWEELLRAQGFSGVLFPETGSPGEALGGHVMAMRASTSRVERSASQIELDELELRAFLRRKLPEYMVPPTFMILSALPLTSNGKVDRQALPAPERGRTERARTAVDPRTVLERELAVIWEQTLGLTQVGIEDAFFEIGGDSLLAVQIVSAVRERLRVELSLRTFFEYPTIAQLSLVIAQRRTEAEVRDESPNLLPPLVPAPQDLHEPFPLTEVQQAYWIGRSGVFELGNVACQVYVELEREDWDPERLEAAFQQVINRHEMLRAVILPDGQQQILANVPGYRFQVLDLRGHDAETLKTELEAVRHQMSHQVLDPEAWPLFDVRVTLLDQRRVRLHVTIDVLIADGLSLFRIFKEWMQWYQDPATELQPLTLSFRDYVMALEAVHRSPFYLSALEYWRGRLATLPPAPQLPLARDPLSLNSPRFVRRLARLDASLWRRLQDRSARRGLTASGVLLAVYAEVLATWSYSPRFTLNLTLFNRLPLHPEVNQVVGDFTSLTLLEVDASGVDQFETRARRLQEQLWSDLDHRHVSGVTVIRELARLNRNEGKAVMPVVFTSLLGLQMEMHSAQDGDEDFGEVVFSVSQTPQVWLDHQVWEDRGDLMLSWDAVETLFPAEMLDDMFASYQDLLRRLADNDEAWELTAPCRVPEAQLTRHDSVNTTGAQQSQEMLHTLFAEQAAQQPDHPAVITTRRQLSYRQLASDAYRVARELRRGGAQPDELIAIVMEKGWEQVVACLGVLFSGAAYLPISADVPPERLHFLLEHGGVSQILTQRWLDASLDWPPQIRRLKVDDELFQSLDDRPLPSVQTPENLAYVIFTSGSTGQPKGVMIDHRAAVNTILDINRRFAIGPSDRVLALSSLSFDLSVYDIFGVLAAGGTIVIPDDAASRDPAHWEALMRRERVTVWNSVPALLQMLVEHSAGDPAALTDCLRLAFLSGDWIPLALPDQLKALVPGAEVISLGGATEAAIWSVLYPIERIESHWTSIPYGRPMANQRMYVLDERLDPRPVHVPGHLYIAGDGLAQGYWRDEARTQASFALHPKTGERLYQTGDLGRWLPDGTLEILGREDLQVKIQGNRIELGEIEATLSRHPAVKRAVVAAAGEPRGERRLVAYVVPQHSTVTIDAPAVVDVDKSAPEDHLDAPTAASTGEPTALILDPAQRLAFKLDHLSLRADLDEEHAIKLDEPLVDESLAVAYLGRRSDRRFLSEPIQFKQLSELLGCLRQVWWNTEERPKYRYPSAGDLYPVQTYLYVKPDRFEGMAEGLWYYHPQEHKLIPLARGVLLGRDDHFAQNQPLFDASAFSLFLVGQLDSVEPLYGSLAREFCFLEAGYIGQLLMSAAPAAGIGLCPVGGVQFDRVRSLLRLEQSHILLHTLLGGAIAPRVIRASDIALPEPAETQSKFFVPALPIRTPAERPLDVELRSWLAEKLPSYMIPGRIVLTDNLPLSANGKIDRRALLALDAEPTPINDSQTTSPTQTVVEEVLVRIMQEVLNVSRIETNRNLFEMGCTSLHVVRLSRRLRQEHGWSLPVTEFFRHPTLRDLALRIEQSLTKTGAQSAVDVSIAGDAMAQPLNSSEITVTELTLSAASSADRARDIAVIGLAARLPGAENADAFWENLKHGVESLSSFTDEELVSYGVPPEMFRAPGYVRLAPVLDDIEFFDAAFFGFSPREAEELDPQHRIFLECAWHALEDGGYDPQTCTRSIGVFGGASMSSYLTNNLKLPVGISMSGVQMIVGNDKDYLATHVSYKLNLSGPSLSVQTACSTSLVAVHLACQSLLARECEMALAGGVTVRVPQRFGYVPQEGGIFSEDGHCRAFDAKATGTNFGNGAGVILLKRLSNALADGDHIYAIIKGSAINNDGSRKVSFTAPAEDGQSRVIAAAQAAANIEPSSVTYVEAHGTGTALGDPIEVAALARVFRNSALQSCALGSVKTNVGHLECAAGIAGLIKTVLALHHRALPPSLHFEQPNPAIDFNGSPFYVNTELADWKRGPGPRRAGVNSFGIGGTNAHVVLEESPERPLANGDGDRSCHLLLLSARTPAALDALAARYRQHFESHPGERLGDICYTLGVGRARFPHRLAVVASTQDQVCEKLSAWADGLNPAGVSAGKSRDDIGLGPVFLFTGQGAQYLGMGRQLYETEPVFREAIERCEALLADRLETTLLSVLYQEHEAPSLLDETLYTQPALFALEYALGQLWLSWGIKPAAVMGHSVGEYVAACFAGILSLEDGLSLIAERGRLMQALPHDGGMAAVTMSAEQVARTLADFDDEVSIAAVNGPEDIVLSGPVKSLERILDSLQTEGARVRRLSVSHAFHSRLMDPILDTFERAASSINDHPATIPFVSNLTGQLVERVDAGYWRRHLRETVRFEAGIKTLQREGYSLFLEVGPQPTLLVMAQRCVPDGYGTWLPSLRKGREDAQQMLESLAALFVRGIAVDWSGVDHSRSRHRLPLPTYPFQRERHWVERHESEATPKTNEEAIFPGHESIDPSRHPLIREPLRLGSGAAIFRSRVGLDKFRYLDHHRVHGRAVLPLTVYLEMVFEAAAQVLGERPLALREIVIQEAILLPEEGEQELELTLTPEGQGGSAFAIYSRSGASSVWGLHLNGQVIPETDSAPVAAVTLSNIQARLDGTLPVDQFYDSLRERGSEYGSLFQAVEHLWSGPGEVLGLVRLPADLEPEAGTYRFHPALLDACLHAIGGALQSSSGHGLEDGAVYLPVGLGRVQSYSHPGAHVWTHIRLPPHAQLGDELLTAEVRVYDDQGQVLAEVDGLQFRKVVRPVRTAARETLEGALYEIGWEARSRLPKENSSMTGGAWLIFADKGGLGHALALALEDQGEACVRVRPALAGEGGRIDASQWTLDPTNRAQLSQLLQEGSDGRTWRGVVHLWSLNATATEVLTTGALASDQELICGSALTLTQALVHLSQPAPPRLYLVTRGAQAVESEQLQISQSPLWGLGRVISVEHPELRCARIDLDPRGGTDEIGELVKELRGGEQEEEIAFRQDERKVARLTRSAILSSDDTSQPDLSGEIPFQLQIPVRGTLENLTFATVQRRPPRPGEVEIRVMATGLNFRDVLNTLGMYPGDPGPLGGECAGIVTAIGEGVDSLSVGDEVFGIAIASFASHVYTAEMFMTRKPPAMSFAEAATIPVVYLTAWYTLIELAKLRAGQRVLVHAAAGGVGLAAVQLIRRAGGEVFATASPGKWDYLKSIGIEHVMNSRTLDFAAEVMQQTGGPGVDIVLNSLGEPTIPASLSTLRAGGAFLEIGKTDIRTRTDLTPQLEQVSYHLFDLGEVAHEDPFSIRRILGDLLRGFEDGSLVPLPRREMPITEVTDAFRFMAQTRHIGKIVVTQPERTTTPERFREDGAYLITGGLGGLGMQLARWMVDGGARRIVLMNRRAANSESLEALGALEQSGAQLMVVQADVSKNEDVARVIAEMEARAWSLKGVVHAAGVLEDGVLLQQHWESFARVMGPKVLGTWNLHAITRGAELDFFILFSSLASVLGSPGQGNYAAANAFLDGLAQERRTCGLPALSINWGPWSGAGMAAALGSRDRARVAEMGMHSIAPADGFKILEKIIASGAAQVSVAPINWPRFLRRFTHDGVPSVLSAIAKTGETNGKPSSSVLLERLRKAFADERYEIVYLHVREQVNRALGLDRMGEVDWTQPLTQFGLDSLMAVELRNALGNDLGLRLSATLFLDNPTIEAVARKLLDEINGEHPVTQQVAPVAAPEHQEESLVEIDDLSQEKLAILLMNELERSSDGDRHE